MEPPPVPFCCFVGIDAAHGHRQEVVCVFIVARIEVVSGLCVHTLFSRCSVRELGHYAGFGDANHLNTLGFHILLQLRGGRRGEVIRIPGEFPVIIIAITFPVVIKSITVNRNILGPVQLYHFIELVFVDIPLKVGESQRPLWHHGRCPCDFGEAGHNLLRLSQHDEIFYVFFLVAAALRRRSPIIEFHLAVGGVCIGIAAVRVHQNTISGS